MPTILDQRLITTYLDRAVEGFSSNPLSARLIRRMASQAPDLFLISALKYLETQDESAAHRLLASMMLRQGSAYEEIADPGRGSLERSITLFTRLWKIDPSFDVKLARKLPDRNGLNHCEAFDAPRSYRVLDVLDETSTGRRLVPVLGHLIDNPNPRIAAQATLFIGKRIQSADWAARQLTRSDPGIRAKAVESIWGLQSPTAQTLLEGCLKDASSDVAGNALVGLHKLGKPGIMEQIGEMVNGTSHGVRSTAALAMGKIGDAVFTDSLTELMRDAHPEVRSTALRSLLQIRKAAAAAVGAAANQPPAVPHAAADSRVDTRNEKRAEPHVIRDPVEETTDMEMNVHLGGPWRYKQVG
jgi:hypothetical protein